MGKRDSKVRVSARRHWVATCRIRSRCDSRHRSSVATAEVVWPSLKGVLASQGESNAADERFQKQKAPCLTVAFVVVLERVVCFPAAPVNLTLEVHVPLRNERESQAIRRDWDCW